VSADGPLASFMAARAWLDLLEEGVVLHGDAGAILAYNAPAARLLGTESSDLVGHATLFPRLHVATVDGEPFRAEDEPVWGALERGEPAAARVVRVRYEDETDRWLALRARLLPREASGAAPGAITLVTDAGALREREQALVEGRREVAMGRMAGHVAHDVHNLLTVILGWSDVLLDSLPAQGPAWQQAREIRAASERGARIAGRMLALGRGEVIETVQVDAHHLLEEMRPTLARVAGETLELRFEPGARRSIVAAEPGGIEQVLMNLVANARDASPDGGRISVSTREAELDREFAAMHPGASVGPHLVLEVADEGSGMSEEARARAFEPFFTTRAERGGLGLGLSIVRTVVQQSNGWIELESGPGAGTKVSVYLPLARDSGSASASGAPAAPEPAPAGGSGRAPRD
jgi:signal transduction histidine kinase